ncbi:MAG: phosphoglycerate kinase [Mycoplasmataceae bacterium]|jgi:phosphoglycerate kinase|nr:phosphoglycerate kinase [Mycoplasmataceae bacterium]
MQNILNKKTLNDIDCNNARVIVRVDFNVPIKDNIVTDRKRIVAALPTIQHLLNNKCKIILLSHLSRIKSLDDIKSNKKSLKPVAEVLQELLPNNDVEFLNVNRGQMVIDAVEKLEPGQILILENTRYCDVNEKGEVVKLESKCDENLGKEWASLASIFVNDAFGTAHRKHASNVGIAQHIPISCIGFLIQKEIVNLSKIAHNPNHPVVAILGGAKVSDKLKVINNLLNIADKVLICGGMAYTFLKTQGVDIGSSLLETEMLDEAKKILTKGKDKIILPQDFRCAPEFADVFPINRTKIQGLNGVMALDIGDQTLLNFGNALIGAQTVFWNGPAGVFEFKNYQSGTKGICSILKKLTEHHHAFTLIGGGDSAAAAVSLGFKEADFSFISTGGGASLEFIEGSPLPGIEVIQNIVVK